MAIYSKSGYVDPLKKKKPVNQLIKDTKLPAAAPAPTVKPSTAAQPSTGFNPTAQAGSTMEKAVKDFSGIPTVTGTVGQVTNPASLYGDAGKTAMDSLNEWLKSAGIAPEQSKTFMDMAAELIGSGPSAVAKPTDLGAPTDYNKPNIQAPTVAGVDPKYAGNAPAGTFVDNAAGPGGFKVNPDVGGSAIPGMDELLSLIGGSDVPGFQELLKLTSGASGNTPGFEEMLSILRGESTMPRVDPTDSGFDANKLFTDPNFVGNRGYELGLSGAEEAQKMGFDDALFQQGADAIQKQLAAGREASGIKAGRDVNSMGQVYVPGTTISDEAMAVHYAPLLAESERMMQELGERNVDRALEQKRFGTEAATNVGSAASGSAADLAKLIQGESQFGDTLRAGQRDTDVGAGVSRGNQFTDILNLLTGKDKAGSDTILEIAKLIQGGEQNRAENIVDVARTVSGDANTIKDLQTQAEEARQRGDMDEYRAITERIDTLNRGAAAESGAATDVFRAETERGLGESAQSIDVNKLNAQLGFDYTKLMTDTGFNYDQLSADNKNKADALAGDIYKADLAAANDQFAQKLRADVDLAGLEQSGQLETAKLLAEQAYKRASLALDTTQSLQSAIEVWNQMLAGATESDRAALLHMWDVWVQDQTRKNEGKFDWAGLAGDVLGAGTSIATAGLMGGGGNKKEGGN